MTTLDAGAGRAEAVAPDAPAIALIGPMAAGKSSLGRKLASRLGRRFIDTDREIVRAYGPVADIFAERGEPAFRALEADAVRDALAPGRVVALGGGAVLDPGTRALLRGVRVALVTVSPEAAARRIRGGTRPLVADGIDAWRRIAAEREPIYRELADIAVDTSARPMAAIVDELEAWAAGQEEEQ